MVRLDRSTRQIISREIGEWERKGRFINGVGGNVQVDNTRLGIEVVPTRLNWLGVQEVHVYSPDGIQEFSRRGKPIKRQQNFNNGNGVRIKAW